MRGFKLYVSNTTTIPPDGYLCYEDLSTSEPNVIQKIPCYQLGKYVIYYDDIGSKEIDTYGPIVELCYVAINGMLKNTVYWHNDYEWLLNYFLKYNHFIFLFKVNGCKS